MKQVYPAFIIKDENDSSGHPYLVNVPDLEILTEGDDLANAIDMARDAIGVTIVSLEDNGKDIPLPSTQEGAVKKIKESTDIVDFSKGIITYVDIDSAAYRRKIDTKTVRRNVALPGWLNYEAEKSGINVSKVLQEALINVLGLTRKV